MRPSSVQRHGRMSRYRTPRSSRPISAFFFFIMMPPLVVVPEERPVPTWEEKHSQLVKFLFSCPLNYTILSTKEDLISCLGWQALNLNESFSWLPIDLPYWAMQPVGPTLMFTSKMVPLARKTMHFSIMGRTSCSDIVGAAACILSFKLEAFDSSDASPKMWLQSQPFLF